MKIIGVDIGGTKISSGVISNEKIVSQETVATPFDKPKQEVVDAVIKSIEKVFDDNITGIGIGVPGLVDLEEDLVIDVVNIPSWDKVPLKNLISRHFNKPVYVNNDANCFAVGEKHFGKGKQYKNFIGVTMGTGLGAGIIINNHLYSGRFCGAGEFGNIYYRDSIVEAYASGQFFKDKGLNGEELAAMAENGDVKSLEYFNELGEHIGKAFANILFALAPEAIVMGGSVSKSFKYFEKGMRDYFDREFPYQRLYKALKIEVSDAENMAILGASSLVLDAME